MTITRKLIRTARQALGFVVLAVVAMWAAAVVSPAPEFHQPAPQRVEIGTAASIVAPEIGTALVVTR